VEAPKIASKHQAGQFVIFIARENSERIPLTMADSNPDEGTIDVVVQAIGKSTTDICNMEEGGEIFDIVGPLGKPTQIGKFGTCVCVCGGIGTAPLHPIAKALKKAGNQVISIIGARTKSLYIMVDAMEKVSDEVRFATDDGSFGRKGFVTSELRTLIEDGTKIDLCIAIGPSIMMKAVCDVTRQHQIKTWVSLNSIMVDGTGMCGACRVSVGGETKFVCVDGPEFDGHQVNFDELLARQRIYLPEEKLAMDKAYPDGIHIGGCKS
jgi:ferredoxin--NADP+ reductase